MGATRTSLPRVLLANTPECTLQDMAMAEANPRGVRLLCNRENAVLLHWAWQTLWDSNDSHGQAIGQKSKKQGVAPPRQKSQARWQEHCKEGSKHKRVLLTSHRSENRLEETRTSPCRKPTSLQVCMSWSVIQGAARLLLQID